MKIKKIVVLSITFVLGLVTSNIVAQSETKSGLLKSDIDYQVIETEKVKVEYFEISNGDFDLLVTPKNEYNISPEFSLEDTKYYKDGYLVGKTKTGAEKMYKTSKNNYPSQVKHDFSWNN